MSTEKLHRIYPPILQQSRDLRHLLTPAEAKVWKAVRNSRLGFKIRRQHPIFRFIADFYCAQSKLVIEIDGDIHTEPDRKEYDAERTRWLEGLGYRVIRFQNNEIHENINGVLKTILSACTIPSPRKEKSQAEGRVQTETKGTQ
jgi:very-short-patch-repair endonuclease